MSAWQDAIDVKKLRLYWDAPPDPALIPKDALIDALWRVLRQKHAAPGNSQDERLEVLTVEATDDGGFRVSIRYVFDNDYASMYDKTETYEAEVLLDSAGALASIPRWDAIAS